MPLHPVFTRCAITTCALVAAGAAHADYPDRPIRLIISSAAGGSPDVVSRILAIELVKQLGQQIVIDNRPGAAQTIGTEMVVRANPDGYTIGYANVVTLAINKALLPKSQQTYDPDKDLVLVGQFLSTYNLLGVTNGLAVKTVQELIDYAKKNPGKLTNASAGNGTTGHLGGELFKIMTGTQIVHVPYKGSPQGIADLISGQVQLMFDNLTSISPHVRSGKIRGIGVSSLKRSPIFPEIPTIAESGVPGYDASTWYGALAPAKTAHAIITRLHDDFVKIMASAEIRERIAVHGYEAMTNTPQEFAAYIKAEVAKWGKVVKATGIRAD